MPEEFRDSPPRGSTLGSIKKVGCLPLYLCVLKSSTVLQIFHEEIALQWIFASGNSSTKNMVLKNSWFFFEMMVS